MVYLVIQLGLKVCGVVADHRRRWQEIFVESLSTVLLVHTIVLSCRNILYTHMSVWTQSVSLKSALNEKNEKTRLLLCFTCLVFSVWWHHAKFKSCLWMKDIHSLSYMMHGRLFAFGNILHGTCSCNIPEMSWYHCLLH